MCLNPLDSYQPNKMSESKPFKAFTLVMDEGMTKKNIALSETRCGECGWISLLQHPSIAFLKFYTGLGLELNIHNFNKLE
jgi:hypothetical protein